MVEVVVGVRGQAHGGGRLAVADAVVGDDDRDRAASQDVKGLEVEVDRVGVAAEVCAGGSGEVGGGEPGRPEGDPGTG